MQALPQIRNKRGSRGRGRGSVQLHPHNPPALDQSANTDESQAAAGASRGGAPSRAALHMQRPFAESRGHPVIHNTARGAGGGGTQGRSLSSHSNASQNVRGRGAPARGAHTTLARGRGTFPLAGPHPTPPSVPIPRASRTRDFMHELRPEMVGTIDKRTFRFVHSTDLSSLGDEAGFDVDGAPDVTISQMEYAGSYSWIHAISPTMLVPGKFYRKTSALS
jgi:hypothetical protein